MVMNSVFFRSEELRNITQGGYYFFSYLRALSFELSFDARVAKFTILERI